MIRKARFGNLYFVMYFPSLVPNSVKYLEIVYDRPHKLFFRKLLFQVFFFKNFSFVSIFFKKFSRVLVEETLSQNLKRFKIEEKAKFLRISCKQILKTLMLLPRPSYIVPCGAHGHSRNSSGPTSESQYPFWETLLECDPFSYKCFIRQHL